MKSFTVLSLALVSPLVNAAAIDMSAVNDTLPAGYFLLDNGKQTELVDEDQLKAYLMSEGIALAPEVDESWLDFTPPADLPDFPEFNSSSPLEARQASCERTTSYVLDKTERFVNWDVQMSPVVLGTAEGITVAVSSGYSVANSISASAGIDVTLIKDYLSGSVGVDYTTTWTTTTSNTYTTVIKNGDAGVWITRPWTNRRSGRTMRGCPGSLTQTGTWMADSYENGSYDNAKWVSGFITTCVKKAPTSGQLTRCNGGGVFV
ncbi:hypothetical protein E8E14_013969 [Neopestalotiopsis sp. 37M]|nr:hypothetical protein E8E14_013969 [Neopestalotiopsis sp. 37M]